MASLSSASKADEKTASVSKNHPFTCVSCRVAFKSSEAQRDHKRSEWHRYNLLRGVESLPPVTSEYFNDKVRAAQAARDAVAAKNLYEKRCQPCKGTYFSENSYQNHLASRKHKANEAAYQSREQHPASPISKSNDNESSHRVPVTTKVSKSSQVAVLSSDRRQTPAPLKRTKSEVETTAITPASTASSNEPVNPDLVCLFCNYRSPTQKLNVTHMSRHHSMFVPEETYLTDLTGLLAYFSEKVREDFQCLSCNALKNSVAAVQSHMRDLGHCKIAFETEDEQLEIGQFYDFRATYSDEEEEKQDEPPDDPAASKSLPIRHKLGAKRGEAVETSAPDDEDETSDAANADGWETDTTDESIASELIGRVYTDPDPVERYKKLAKNHHHTAGIDPRPHHTADGWHSHAHHHHHAAFRTEYELYLPSGKAVGHRSLNRYYRQNLHDHPQPRLRSPPPPRRAIEGGADDDDDSDEDVDAAAGDGNESETGPSSRQLARQARDRGRQLVSRATKSTSMAGVPDERKRAVAAAEKKSRQIENRERNRYEWGNNKRSNRQKHFRDPLLQ